MSENWIEVEKKYYMQSVRRQPIVLVRGQGVRAWDEKGKGYLDFVAGWAVNSLGHSHPVIVSAIQEQAKALIQASNQFYTVPQLKLAQFLVEKSGMSRVFFCNSGAEANEGAVKLARKYGNLHLNGAYEVISATNSFHGRTLAMVAATGQPRYQEPFRPLPEGFVNVEYNSLEAIKRSTSNKSCAVLLEPLQGEGGVVVPSPDYLKEVRRWCDERGMLLILDEIQTGMGRLGALFGFQLFGVEPDVMTLAKGMGGGIPIGAFLANSRADVFEPGDHGSTFGGNPLACAVALAVGQYIVERDIPSHVAHVGEHLKMGLEALKGEMSVIREVRGMGLLLAVEFTQEISAKVVTACNEEGLLVNAVRPNAIRLMPPLIITSEEVDEGLARLNRAMIKVAGEVAPSKR